LAEIETPRIESPTVYTYPWPSADEPVSIDDAMAAMSLGHAPTIARYLRKGDEDDGGISPLVPLIIAELLDPTDHPSSSPLPDYLHTKLKLVFIRKRRGRHHSIKYDLTAIGELIGSALGNPPNLEAAVATVRQQTGIGRATAFRAWQHYKKQHALDWS
jgi:hypothetical protein